MLSKRSGAAAASRLISRCVKAPARVLYRACDLYVRGITSCGTKMSYGGGAVGLGQQAAPMLPRSFSVQSGRSSVSGDEDFRDLVMAATGGSSVPPPQPPSVVPRSRTVAIGRIDEDKPCVFEEDLSRGSDYLFPRSRSYAAAAAAAKGRRIAPFV